MKKTLIAMMVAGTIIAGGCGPKAEQGTPAIDLKNMDLSINPADDFFRYCNNNWLKNNPIPEEYTTYGAFTEIDQHNEILIQGIIDEASKDVNATQGSVSQKIRDFYNAGMDTAARAKSLFITDRREAIRTALMTAPQGAVILVAGKGHEDYQVIGTTKIHFDDKEVIAETFEEMK